MNVLALVLLAIAAALPALLNRRRFPDWLAPGVAIAALAGAAIAAAYGDEVGGFGIGATVVLAVAAAAFGGTPIPPAAFRLARRGPAPTGTTSLVAAGPLRGGLLIGILERTAVAAAIVAAKGPEGIAIVMAVKGLARYPELREPTASEQFIIGTFTSVLWAVACAGAAITMA